jgi:hypothetical protein
MQIQHKLLIIMKIRKNLSTSERQEKHAQPVMAST